MGLFRRDPRRDLAKAIAKRGVRVRARVDGMRETGETHGGAAREVEFRLSFDAGDHGRVAATVVQFMNDATLTGLAESEPAEISYDAEDPSRVVVWGSPRYRMVEGVPVPVEDADTRGLG